MWGLGGGRLSLSVDGELRGEECPHGASMSRDENGDRGEWGRWWLHLPIAGDSFPAGSAVHSAMVVQSWCVLSGPCLAGIDRAGFAAVFQ